MRPIRLVIEGVNSFTDAQELDFDAVGRVNLFCICGKTGAGKTTIFDSIMLALYGRSGKGNLADVVNLSRNSASVVFDFSSDGEIYRVERTIKCRGEKSDKSDKPDGDALIKRTAISECTLYKVGAPIAKGEEATAKIEEIVGLAASEFKNVYLLEQGEYAEFLKLTPAKQTEAVGKIFALTRFGEVYARAGDRMKAADTQIAVAQQSIENLGDASDGAVKDKKTELASLKAKAASVERELARKKSELEEQEKKRDAYKAAIEKQRAVNECAERLEKAELGKQAADKATADFCAENAPDYDGELNVLRARINELSVLVERDRECDAAEREAKEQSALAEQKAAECEAKEREFGQKRDAADAEKRSFISALEEFTTAAGKAARPSEVLARAVKDLSVNAENAAESATLREAYYALKTELDNHNAVRSAAEKAKAREDDAARSAGVELDKIASINDKLGQARGEAAAAAETAERAEAELIKAQVHSHAAAVAAELADGDTCPVCGGVYHGASRTEAGDVEAKKRERDAAAEKKRDAEKQVSALEKLVDSAKLKYEQFDETAKSARAERETKEQELEALCVDGDLYVGVLTILERAGKLAVAYEKSLNALRELLPSAEKATAERDAAARAAEEKAKRAAEIEAKLGEYRGKAAAELAAVREKAAATEKLKADREAEKQRLERDAAAAAATVKAAEESLEAARRACPSDVPEFDEGAYVAAKEDAQRQADKASELKAAVARTEAELYAVEEKAGQRKALEARRDEAVKTYNIYKEIADITKGKKMLDFVATEYIEDFTAAASDILSTLSGGKYTMRYDRDGGFVVSDFLNEGKARKTDTLSGGEMFLASLAVAIAIARSVSGGDNAFFFLDEGFGTLDEELIDTVYAALEGLASSCLVGVISHSSALIERMPSCVEVVEATDTTGSRIKY